jgi:N-formylglutamate amidohydrolase
LGGTVIHIPHASTAIPEDVREQFQVTDAELAHELRVMTDHLTGELFDIPGTAIIRFPVSRLVVDPERFERDDQETMSRLGMGVVYSRTAAQTPLRRSLDPAEREQLLERWYRPHHAALAAAAARMIENHGSCLIIDAHSFPSRPLPYELDQNPYRPDICVGTDTFHTPAWLGELAARLCREAGWSVEMDRPFAGALVPGAFYGIDARVRAIMIEVNRGLYLDESTATASPGLDTCRKELATIVRALIAHEPSRSF